MQMPKITNSVVFQEFCDRENNYMSIKLNSAKPRIDFKCPESFNNFKHRNKSTKKFHSKNKL